MWQKMTNSKSKFKKEWGYCSKVQMEYIYSVKWCIKLQGIKNQDTSKELKL
jgi:hypothetical protein